MSEPVPRNAILASPSINEPGVIDHLNRILDDADLGRVLGPPVLITPTVVALPVSGDPRKVVAALRVVPEGGDHHVDLHSSYGIHTIKHRTKGTNLVATEFTGSGAKSGHGTVSWEVVRKRAMPKTRPWRPTSSPPVVVVLDSGVRQHSWLPPETRHPEFWVDAAKLGFSPRVPVPDPALRTGNFGAYWVHATFLAGLIRLHAPDAQVLSMRLMNDAGKIDDHNVIPALKWLSRHKHHGGAVDVVLMAFGRPKEPDEPNPYHLTNVITKLRRQGIKLVASAGNARSHQKTIPACLDNVVSVGAGISAKDREWYSNYGPWVRKWRPGAVVSLMPLVEQPENDPHKEDPNGFALWSGTSFSAAILAGELAQEKAEERKAGGGS